MTTPANCTFWQENHAKDTEIYSTNGDETEIVWEKLNQTISNLEGRKLTFWTTLDNPLKDV